MKSIRWLAALALLNIPACSKTSEEFQRDADVFRLRHLKHYGLLLEEYHAKAGKYPFQGMATTPVYVIVANDKQAEYAKQDPPYPHVQKSFKDFVLEVEAGLGREIEEYYDPQYAPAYKPNFYIYMIHGNTYFFAVHTHQAYSFAKVIAKNYHKVEISNNPNEQNQARYPKEFFASAAFSSALNASLAKEGFFREREAQYLHFTKGWK